MDVALDFQLAKGALMTIMYIAFIASGHDFVWTEILGGSATGFCFMLGAILSSIAAFDIGPDGSISAVSSTQIVYQALITAIFFGYGLSISMVLGLVFSTTASFLITFFIKNRNRLNK